MINNKVSYNNETKYEFKWIIIRIIMIKIKIKIIEKELTSSCKKKKKNTRLIFENVTAGTLNQSCFKNPARSMNVFPFLLKSLYIIIIIIYFIISIYWLLV